jgi:hypothetical protein
VNPIDVFATVTCSNAMKADRLRRDEHPDPVGAHLEGDPAD